MQGPVQWARMLVDGYNLLHRQRALAGDFPPHSQPARHHLIRSLLLYQDATGNRVVAVFDGRSPSRRDCTGEASGGLEVIYSPEGRTADGIIEELAERYRPWGGALVITDDLVQQSMVESLGGMALGTGWLVREMEEAQRRMEERVRRAAGSPLRWKNGCSDAPIP